MEIPLKEFKVMKILFDLYGQPYVVENFILKDKVLEAELRSSSNRKTCVFLQIRKGMVSLKRYQTNYPSKPKKRSGIKPTFCHYAFN